MNLRNAASCTTNARWYTESLWLLLASAGLAALWFGANGCVSAELTVDSSDVRFQKESAPVDAGWCGDGIAGPGEMCDGTDFGFGPATCEEFGYDGGTLRCSDDCQTQIFDDCAGAVCGNGIVDDGEACDVGEDAPEECPYEESCTLCVDCEEVAGAARVCGDGVVDADGGEECDQDGISSCTELGYDSGDMSCTPACLWDVDDCVGTFCGDGVVQADEVCEPGDTDFGPCEDEFERLGLGRFLDAGTDFGGEAICEASCDGWKLDGCTVRGVPLYEYLANQEGGSDGGIAEPTDDAGSDGGVGDDAGVDASADTSGGADTDASADIRGDGSAAPDTGEDAGSGDGAEVEGPGGRDRDDGCSAAAAGGGAGAWWWVVFAWRRRRGGPLA